MHTSIYSSDAPDILDELADTPEMQRLAGIGMHCGCEYTELPAYKNEPYPYSRLLHSIGVSRIVWRFTRDIRQAVAGLLHDIATPVFAHTIDFMNNDHIKQETTEEKTLSFIVDSEPIMRLLEKNRIRVEDVCDYHQYPIADNDTPMLSADRLEYTLGNGYLINGHSLSEIRDTYGDLTVGVNESGHSELCFQTIETAKAFTHMALRNSRFYVSESERFAMQCLADIMRRAMETGVLDSGDLHSTESEVIAKLKNDGELRADWDYYTRISGVSSSPVFLPDCYCVNVPAKKRYIDPPVLTDDGLKRVSLIDAEIRKDIESFLGTDFNYWLYADAPCGAPR